MGMMSGRSRSDEVGGLADLADLRAVVVGWN